MGATSTITRNTTLPDSSAKSDFHNLVDTATIALVNVADTATAQTMSGQKPLSQPLLYTGSGQPKETIVLTAAGATVPGTSGAAKTKVNGTNFSYYTLDFDKTSNELAYWTFIVPDRITGTTANIYVYWTSTRTSPYIHQL